MNVKRKVNRLYGDDAKSVMAQPNKLAQKEQVQSHVLQNFAQLKGNPTTKCCQRKTRLLETCLQTGELMKKQTEQNVSLEKTSKRKASNKKVLVNINIPQVKVQDVRCHTKPLLQKECLRDVSAKSCVASVESTVKNQ